MERSLERLKYALEKRIETGEGIKSKEEEKRESQLRHAHGRERKGVKGPRRKYDLLTIWGMRSKKEKGQARTKEVPNE